MYLKKENNRHGEAGDASARATKPPPPRDTLHGLWYRFSSRGSLHALPKPTHWVRDDDKEWFFEIDILNHLI